MMSATDFAAQRMEMVEVQLRRRGISDPRVLAAMASVPREKFVLESMQDRAYDDGALPIGYGQTISQPYVVAFMTEVAQVQPEDKVLEIGTGSGYAAAVLGQMCREVHTVERIAELAEQARERLQRLGLANIFTHVDDGTAGLPSHAPYAAILVPAAAKDVPQPLLAQLAEGGRLVIPIGDRERGQRMLRYTRAREEFTCEDLGAFAFVPLIGEYGWHEG
jgi:protein-L-isoaspartate(D-aspartate) O-methyltransferase